MSPGPSASTARSSGCRTCTRSATSRSSTRTGCGSTCTARDAADWQPGSILYFRVDDIHAAQAALADRGVHFTGAPHVIHTDDETGAEVWMTFFDDGEGNTLALMAQVEARG